MPATAALEAGPDAGVGGMAPSHGKSLSRGHSPLLRGVAHQAGLRSNSSAKRSRCASDCTVRASVTQLL